MNLWYDSNKNNLCIIVGDKRVDLLGEKFLNHKFPKFSKKGNIFDLGILENFKQNKSKHKDRKLYCNKTAISKDIVKKKELQ